MGIGFCKGWVVHEIVIKGRHQIEIGHALGRNQPQGFGGVKPAQANKCAADERHRQERAHAHRVIKRHDAKRALAAAVKILRDMRQSCGALGALPAWNALRPRRRAGRVEHHRPGLGVDARARLGPIAIGKSSEWRITGRNTVERNARQPRRQLRSSDRRRGSFLINNRLGFGVLQKEIEFACRRSPVHRRDDYAGKLAGPMQGRRFPAVLQRGHDALAGCKSERIEAGDQRRDAPIPLPIG